MGAILAVIGEAGDPELPERLEKMIAVSPYRGRGEHLVAGGVALGVQSLGTDASFGEVGPYIVAFNGWVANWDELGPRPQVEPPAAANDAKRMAIAFQAWGERVFARLRGEFAVLILNRQTRVLTAARDVVGVRPLFFHRHAGRTYLASEQRQVRAGSEVPPALDETFLASALARRYGGGEETLDLNVRRVVPGHLYSFRVDKSNEAPRRVPYWTPPTEDRTRNMDERALAEELRCILDRAVGRTLADRPGAVALSGGMDSSSIWALIRQRARAGEERANLASAISMLFPGFDCDESDFIHEIHGLAGGEALYLDAAAVEPFPAIEALIKGAESLFGPTLYHTALIAEAAHNRGLKVVYLGFGGDEWLIGSPYYLGDQLRRGHFLEVLADATVLLHGTTLERTRKLVRFTVVPMTGVPWRQPKPPAWLRPSRLDSLFLPPTGAARSRAGVALERALFRLRAGSSIEEVELVCARAGIELRCPLHDLDVVGFAFATPGRPFMGGQRPKHLLRVAMADLLPASVVDRRDRTEFSAPFRSGVRSFARGEDPASWCLVARQIVMREDVQRLRDEVAGDASAAGFYDFLDLAIAERLCRRFEACQPAAEVGLP